jgi:2-oxo-4-hydroxy-4-carboxy-5-ureidoimidazoline decarboxylase
MEGSLTIDQANQLTLDEFVETFGPLYEHSPWVAEAAWRRRPFDGLEDLQRALEEAVVDAPPERQLALIRSHPELAGPEASEGTLTAESTSEQASAGLDRLSAQDVATLRRLNAAYREKFGFPLVVAVREHTKQSIFAQAQTRLANPEGEEVRTALGEIFKIARLRLRELVSDGDRGRETA